MRSIQDLVSFVKQTIGQHDFEAFDIIELYADKTFIYDHITRELDKANIVIRWLDRTSFRAYHKYTRKIER